MFYSNQQKEATLLVCLFVFPPVCMHHFLYSFTSRDEQNVSPEAVLQTAFKATFQINKMVVS